MKSQLKSADRSGARLALIVGPDEVAAGSVSVRPLRGEGTQRTVPRAEVVDLVRGAAQPAHDGSPIERDRAGTAQAGPAEPQAGRVGGAHPERRSGGDRPKGPSMTATPEATDGTCGATSMRTHLCGRVTTAEIGDTVRLCGWVAKRREHGEHLAFVDLRDHTGIVQCVVPGTVDVRSEYVIAVEGVVRHRPEGTVNPDLPTGEIEVGDCVVEVLAAAEPPPFAVDDRVDADEGVRLRSRFIDLRRPRMQANLRLRAQVNAALRSAMERQGFCEVETPMLWAPTPEGAREFAVPSRLHQGSFYVLPQSPQLAKQLLMVAGVDRYFQIARCMRDEDLRADRQFEFTQLDVEASFVSQDDVLGFVSEAVLDAAEVATGERPPAIEQMTWSEALDRFGTDKPDLRFGMELVDLSPVFEGTEVKAFSAPCVKAVRLEGGSTLTRSKLDTLTDKAKQLGAKGLAWFRVTSGGSSRLRSGRLGRGRRTGRGRLRCRWARSRFAPRPLPLRSGALGSDRHHRGGGRGPHPRRRRRAPAGLHRARPAPGGAGCPSGERGTVPVRLDRGLSHVRRGGRGRESRSPPITPSPCPTPTTWTGSSPIRPRCGPRPTTWCSTDGSWVRAASGSIAPTSRAGCSTCWASPRRRPSPGSASCSGRSATALLPTLASPWVSTGWWPSSPARTASGRSSPSPRPSPAPIP